MQGTSGEVTLGYWAIRGLAEGIRLLMEYTGLKYQQKKYTSLEGWLADKTTMGLDFPNLPYLVDGTKKLTESEAIYHYICLKTGRKELLGKTDDDVVNLALVRGVLFDARHAIMTCVYDPNYEKIIGDTLAQKVHPKFEQINKFAEANGGKGLIGTQITYIDFIFYELAQLLLTMNEKFFERYPTLNKIISTIGEDPKIRGYIKSDRFQARPFNGFPATYNPK